MNRTLFMHTINIFHTQLVHTREFLIFIRTTLTKFIAISNKCLNAGTQADRQTDREKDGRTDRQKNKKIKQVSNRRTNNKKREKNTVKRRITPVTVGTYS